MAERLKLMADYQCWPLWRNGGVNVDPASLGVSNGLHQRLLEWADRFDATLSQSDPRSSGFATPEAAATFDRDGQLLWRDLSRELGATAEVTYFSPREKRELGPGDGTAAPGD